MQCTSCNTPFQFPGCSTSRNQLNQLGVSTRMPEHEEQARGTKGSGGTLSKEKECCLPSSAESAKLTPSERQDALLGATGRSRQYTRICAQRSICEQRKGLQANLVFGWHSTTACQPHS